VSRTHPAVREAAVAAIAAAKPKELERLATDLFAMAGLLAREPRLRRALVDPGVPVESRRALLSDVVGDRLTQPAMPVLGVVLESGRQDREVVDLVEELGAEAAFAWAEAGGALDRVREELFRLKLAIEGSAPLQIALADPAVPDDRKVAVIDDLLDGKAAAPTVALVHMTMQAGRARELGRVLGRLVDLAAARAGAVVAQVRTAVALDERRRRSLSDALSRAVGGPVSLEEIVDPSVVGSLSIRVGDEVFDGSVKRQLELARERLGAA
jgi:F-type H+-transporting ATPase subunit delta